MDRFGHKQRIGILGGTFDPIHLGHLFLAETARLNLKLDKVLFIPAWRPPHKNRADISDAEMRYAMIKLATAGNPWFCPSRIEIKKQDVSYSVETLRSLRKRYPDADFYFIIGSDALPELKTWKQIEEIYELCRFVVAPRPDMEKCSLPKKALFLKGGFLNISSTTIRQLLRSGKAIRYLVPEKVYQFIKKHNMYTG
ncbi:MAG: nicotinate-nucleotide adenylyltransferase [Candidatus Omnitrophica bacterium]|nr:nicotinate-nucleotide adenylyltransferase [Candidatus Omnitrophota bacterium]MBU4479624.1 nicotinate-nucleotide adenylyltransferase [Candidatus Omnitrophota bacterium]MCG2703706.1 nicotinate-nucleotide adenylyltransferase [Candidatus Omnitrophota bacterium]